MGLANNFPQGNEREILTNSRYESSTLSTARRDQWWLKRLLRICSPCSNLSLMK